MEPIFEVINALNALTTALTKLTEQTTQKEMDKFEHAEHPTVRCADTISAEYQQIYPPAEEHPHPEPVTLAEVRAVLANKSRAGFTEEVKQLVMKHGAEKLSGVPESEYAALMKEAESLGT